MNTQGSLRLRRKLLPFLLLPITALSALLLCGADSARKEATPVISVREFELRPGAKAEEFERFVRGEFGAAAVAGRPGVKLRVMKGDRGERKGGYILVWEFDSLATRNECFPQEGGWASSDFRGTLRGLKSAMDKFYGFVKEESSYTDYVTVSN
jgi:hypothetical protein